jgi:hypothetical protein
LGRAEQRFNIKLLVNTYEVTGSSADIIKTEVNFLLERIHAIMQDVQVAETRQHVRLQFDVEGTRKEQEAVLDALKRSSVLESVTPLGPVQTE